MQLQLDRKYICFRRHIFESPYTLSSTFSFFRLPFPPHFSAALALWTNWYAEVQIEPLSTPARALYPQCNYRECHLSRRYTRGYIRISAGYNAALREIYSRKTNRSKSNRVIRQPIKKKKKIGNIFRESVSSKYPLAFLIHFLNKLSYKNFASINEWKLHLESSVNA